MEKSHRKCLAEAKRALESLDPSKDLSAPYITNTTARVDLDVILDLHKVAQNVWNVEYNPKRFPAAILRLRNPPATALLFSTGIMNVMGCSSPKDNKLAARKFARSLQRIGYKVRLYKYELNNVVAACSLGVRLDLNKLNIGKYGAQTIYETELFPGMTFKIFDPKMTLVIFDNGNIVFTGAKSQEDIDRALDFIRPILISHVKVSSSADDTSRSRDSRAK
ncbi:putative TATA-box binding protein [Piedraia hortae CBS 480.64]|uniref:Putative TATA-box binding protein n=1 Tax=Piedraia hortae CBS 480.64 TaxID=1314780 RepID=A0A6A7C0R4_9PEZI|nr:putative TATA-box binding protein [Piedraia hortae CBS 480.64]